MKGIGTMMKRVHLAWLALAIMTAGASAQTITGNGSTNQVPVFTGSSAISGNSNITSVNGNVGIGTTNPEAKLDVNGATAVNGNLLYLAGYGNSTHWIQYNGTSGNDTWNYWSNLDFQSYNNGSNSHTLWLGSTGNIGIGTTAPNSILEISVPDGAGTGLGTQVILSRIDNGTSFRGSTIGHYFSSTAGDFLGFAASGSGSAPPGKANVQMVLTGAGAVGIGTTNPQYPLSVNGTIQAKEVLVNTGWSDYVFEPTYRVKPLTEVAAFINANHHLPDIPSEAEVKEKGVSLGDMQSKLLAKIEELTLQMIQLDEKNTALEKKLAQFEGRQSDKTGADR